MVCSKRFSPCSVNPNPAVGGGAFPTSLHHPLIRTTTPSPTGVRQPAHCHGFVPVPPDRRHSPVNRGSTPGGASSMPYCIGPRLNSGANMPHCSPAPSMPRPGPPASQCERACCLRCRTSSAGCAAASASSSAVHPLSLWALHLAPAHTSRSTTSALLRYPAQCSAVCPPLSAAATSAWAVSSSSTSSTLRPCAASSNALVPSHALACTPGRALPQECGGDGEPGAAARVVECRPSPRVLPLQLAASPHQRPHRRCSAGHLQC
eukprot:1461517-Rhodomonas_salina.1